MNNQKLVTLSIFTALSLMLGCNEPTSADGSVTDTGSSDQLDGSGAPPSEPLDGKVDQVVELEPVRYATCNEGAFVVDRVRDEYVATITDSGVVEYFIEQSQSVLQTSVEYSGESRVTSVQRALPWMVTVRGSEDGSRQLVISDFHLEDEGESLVTSGQPGSTITHIDGGLKLVINGSKMTSSHTISYYEVGNWFFERCELEGEDSTAVDVETQEVVAECNEGALVLEPSAEREGELIALVTDPEAVDYFVQQSGGVYCEELSYSGERRAVCVQRQLHHSVTLTEDGSLLVDGLQASRDSFAVSGRAGARLDREGQGLRLTLSGSAMTSSHTVSYYEVGSWLFETCSID